MKTNENGRSMIEMLGVLAIIGVLSVGGIYGYTVAMRKYKANEIAQTLSMLATLAHAKNAGAGGTVTLATSGLEKKPAGVTLDTTGTKAECDTSVDSNCTMVKVTLAFDSTAADKDNLKKAVCQIVPKTSTAGETAGYYLGGCTS